MLTGGQLRNLFLRAAATLAPRVPARPGYRGAAALADLLWCTAADTRTLIGANLRVVLGADAAPDRLRTLTRLAFRNLAWNYLELFRLGGPGLDEVRAQITVDGLAHLERAAANSRTGVILVFGHVGNLEALSQVPVLLPRHRFTLVVENMADRQGFALFQRLRGGNGLELVRTDEPYRLLRALRDGRHVIVCGDLDTTGTGVVVEFFGRPVRAPAGAERLALRTGAPLLMVAGWREDMRRPQVCRARIDPPLRLTGSAREPDDVRGAVQLVMRQIERQVTARPEQWLAFRKVWEAA